MTRQELLEYIKQNYNEIQQLELLLEIFANMMDVISYNSIAPTDDKILADLDGAYALLSRVRNEVTRW